MWLLIKVACLFLFVCVRLKRDFSPFWGVRSDWSWRMCVSSKFCSPSKSIKRFKFVILDRYLVCMWLSEKFLNSLASPSSRPPPPTKGCLVYRSRGQTTKFSITLFIFMPTCVPKLFCSICEFNYLSIFVSLQAICFT